MKKVVFIIPVAAAILAVNSSVVHAQTSNERADTKRQAAYLAKSRADAKLSKNYDAASARRAAYKQGADKRDDKHEDASRRSTAYITEASERADQHRIAEAQAKARRDKATGNSHAAAAENRVAYRQGADIRADQHQAKKHPL